MTYMDTYMGRTLGGEEARLGALTLDEAVDLIARKRGTVTMDGRCGSVGNLSVHVVVPSADGRKTFEATRSDGASTMGSRQGTQVLLAAALIECHRQAARYAQERAWATSMANVW